MKRIAGPKLRELAIQRTEQHIIDLDMGRVRASRQSRVSLHAKEDIQAERVRLDCLKALRLHL